MRTLMHFSPSPEKSVNQSVVLIHGLFMSGLIMLPMALYLRNKGFEVFICDYATRTKNVKEHGTDLTEYLRSLNRKNINLVTHSLGGIITREMLCRLERSESNTPSIGNIVMLAPPHHGSHVARLVCALLPSFAGKLAKPLPELSSSSDSYVRNMPVSKKTAATIAGLIDIEVRPESTHIASSTPRKTMLSGHTLMPVYPHVLKELHEYLLHSHPIRK